jgi:hypothetical protein
MAERALEHHPLVNWRQAGIGVAALVAGAALYLLERPLGPIALTPEGWSLIEDGGPILGFLGRVLPDVLHPFAFAMLTGALLLPGTLRYGLACLAWATFDLVLEAGQAPPVLAWLEETLAPWAGQVPGVDLLLAYFGDSVFTVMNLLAVVLGACAAWLVLQVTARREDLGHIA